MSTSRRREISRDWARARSAALGYRVRASREVYLLLKNSGVLATLQEGCKREEGETNLFLNSPSNPTGAVYSRDELRAGRATRSVQAQQQTAGFGFKQLSLGLIEAWELPPLIGQLAVGQALPPRPEVYLVGAHRCRERVALGEPPTGRRKEPANTQAAVKNPAVTASILYSALK